MKKKPSQIDETDKEIFRDAMRGVKPIVHTKISPEPAKPKKPLYKAKQPLDLNPLNFRESEYNTSEVSGDESLEFYRTGLQHKVLRKFRRGQYNVEARLDMHGMRVEEAREALNRFLLSCVQNNIKHAIIIHGKGSGKTKPILKNKLNQWLRQTDYVLAFCSATQRDGNTGAVYVLLKGSSQIDE